MGISYDSERQIFLINTEHTSYIMGLSNDYLGHIYYGKRVNVPCGRSMLRDSEMAYFSGNIGEKCTFADSYPFEYGTGGTGDFRESCIELTNVDGYTGCEFKYVSHRIYKGKDALAGLPHTFGSEDDTETLEIRLHDEVLGVKLYLSYSVFAGIDAICRSIRIVNDSEAAVEIRKLMSASFEMDAADCGRPMELISLHGSWARERSLDRRPMGHGGIVINSNRGISSHQDHPFIAVVSPDATETAGDVWAMNFVYSGNFEAVTDRTQHDRLRVMMGINHDTFDWTLRPGEEFTAPEVVTVYSAEGLGAMSRTFHDLYRGHLIRSKYLHMKRPILINNWEATYFNFDTEKLLSIARAAKESGIEMLVMDDGWFGHRSSDNSSLGDWQVNTEKLPGGLEYLVSEVNKIGLKFGIWFEPEMVSPDSELYRAHSDWAIAIPGREASQCRTQFVLDLTREEVRDYVYESIAAVLRSANIEYVKWDMNRPLTDIGSTKLKNQGELLHRYMLGVYEIQERMITEFPNLLLENCSSGGARLDPGMLYYSPQIWCSDDTDAMERLSIQEGTTLMYPLSAMGAHVSDCPNHIVGRTTDFATRGIVALSGTFGYELDITKISEADRGLIPKQVALYHRVNDLVREGDYYRLASGRDNGEFYCWSVVAKDKSEVLVSYVQQRGGANLRTRAVKLQGLDTEAEYILDRSMCDGFIDEKTGDAADKNSAAEESATEIYRGDELMYVGFITDKLWGDGKGRLYHFVRKG